MLFSRYSGASNHVLNYEFEFGLEIIKKAKEKEIEEEMRRRWLIGGYEHEMSFSNFKQMLIGKGTSPTTEKTEKEIFTKVREILEMRRE